jgi:hypothetical protein
VEDRLGAGPDPALLPGFLTLPPPEGHRSAVGWRRASVGIAYEDKRRAGHDRGAGADEGDVGGP